MPMGWLWEKILSLLPTPGKAASASSRNTPASDWKTGATFAALLAITAVAGAMRLYAVHHFSYGHPDEEIARAVVISVLKSGDYDTNWARTDVIPTFHYTEYNFSSYYLFTAVAERFLGHAENDIAHPYGSLRVHLREISAMLGALCVLFAGLFGWQVGGRRCGLITAVLTASCVTLFQDGIYARPETFVTLLTLWLLMVLASTRVHRGLVLVVAGLLVGLLIACKITFLLFFPFPILLAPAMLTTPKDGKPLESHLFLWSGSILAYFLAIGAGFALGAPYAVRLPWEYVQGLVPLMLQYENGTWSNELGGGSALRRLLGGSMFLVVSLGIPLLLLALASLGRMLWRRDIRLLLVIGGPLLTLLYFLQTKAFFERNFSQALPVLFMLAALAISWLTDLIPRPALRIGATAVLLGLVAAVPASVTAKAIDPALDGRYQQEIDATAQRLTQGGVSLLNPDINEIRSSGVNSFCGSYIYRVRTLNPKVLKPLLNSGFTVLAQIHSVFGDSPTSTLQSYLSPPVAFIAPPKAESCNVELSPLAPQPDSVPVHAQVKTSADWPAAGSAVPSDAGWPWPRYSSQAGSDQNTGSLTIGPFHACGDFTVPFLMGPARQNATLRILHHVAGKDVEIYSGVPPTAIDLGQWQRFIVRQPAGSCGDYQVIDTDNGKGWGEWLDVGMPVAAKPKAGR